MKIIAPLPNKVRAGVRSEIFTGISQVLVKGVRELVDLRSAMTESIYLVIFSCFTRIRELNER